MAGGKEKLRFDFGAKAFFDGLHAFGSGRLTAVAWLCSFAALVAFVASEEAPGAAPTPQHASVTTDVRRWLRAAISARLQSTAGEPAGTEPAQGTPSQPRPDARDRSS